MDFFFVNTVLTARLGKTGGYCAGDTSSSGLLFYVLPLSAINPQSQITRLSATPHVWNLLVVNVPMKGDMNLPNY